MNHKNNKDKGVDSMHMGFFYYVINLGLLLLFSFWYMKKYWTDDKFDEFSKGKDKGAK